MMEYINRYGEDETTIIPGTNKHFNYEKLKESKEDIKNDRVMTIEESKERLMQKCGNLTIK